MGHSPSPDPPLDVEGRLAELAGCLDTYLTHGDPEPLLSPSASRLAADIAEEIESDGRVTVAHARVLGPFHWYRHRLTATGDESNADQMMGLRYLAALAGGDLASVPRELQVLLSGSGMVGDGPYQWYQQGLVLSARAETESDTAALSRSIELFRMALDTPGLPAADVASVLSHLGVAHRIRYERCSAPEDVDEAVRAGRSAVEAARSDGTDQVVHQGRLAAALQTRYRHAGDRRDLDEAIAVTRAALNGLDDHHPDAVICLINGSGGLYLRFTDYGALGDLDDAIRMARAVEAGLRVDGATPSALSAVTATNLSVYLQNRYEHNGDPADLDDSISASRRAVARTGNDHPDFASKLSNLSAALLARYRRQGAEADLDEAVEVGDRAAHTVSAGDWNSASCWSNLANALRYRYWRDDVAADLDAAVDAARRAVADATEREGGIALFQRNLSLTLLSRFDRDGDPGDLAEAATLLEAVYRSRSAAASLRLDSAVSLVAVPLPDPDRRLAAGMAAVELLPLVAWFALGRQDRERALAGTRGVGTDASAHAVAARRTDLAVEVLEQGRAVLWTQALNLRTDLTALTSRKPEIAGRLDTIRRELDAPSTGAASTG